MPDLTDDFRPSVLRARAILERQVAGTPVTAVDARIAELRRLGMHVRAQNLLRARIAAHGEAPHLQSEAFPLKTDAS